jgi:hypothetical protein
VPNKLTPGVKDKLVEPLPQNVEVPPVIAAVPAAGVPEQTLGLAVK